jgi:hypothetical protein
MSVKQRIQILEGILDRMAPGTPLRTIAAIHARIRILRASV